MSIPATRAGSGCPRIRDAVTMGQTIGELKICSPDRVSRLLGTLHEMEVIDVRRDDDRAPARMRPLCNPLNRIVEVQAGQT